MMFDQYLNDDALDRLDKCQDIICFLSDFVGTMNEAENFHFSKEGQAGLYWILDGLANELKKISDALTTEKNVVAT